MAAKPSIFLQRKGKFSGRTNDRPKLILLDIKMPRVDGIEVLRVIMADDHLRVVPAVMLTSSAEERDLLASYQLGANSHIVKPIDFDAFYRTVTDVGLYWMLENKVALKRRLPALHLKKKGARHE